MIRALTSKELEVIRPLAERCFVDFKYPGKGLSWETFENLWKPAIGADRGVIFTVDDPPSGLMGAMFGPDQFSGDPVCFVNFWFVLPEMRHLGRGGELLAAMESEARDRGCFRILMGHPPGHTKYFQAHGFQPIEVGFHKVL